MSHSRHDVRWAIVERRDRRFDGAFVYAVSSTRIYCKPSCPSRRPLPQHVRFFESPRGAELAGYRACRRCRPATAAPDPRVRLVTRAFRLLHTATDACSVNALAGRLRVSADELRRVFSAVVGVSPLRVIAAYRLRRFKNRIRNGAALTEAMYEAGYGSSSRLYENAAADLGMTPATYRRGGAGETISYTIAGCRGGSTLVAMTSRGICAVAMGRDDEVLLDKLAGEYPAARIEHDPSLASIVSAACDLADRAIDQYPLPSAPRAIAFELCVGEALRSHNRMERSA